MRCCVLLFAIALGGTARAEPPLAAEMQLHFDGERDQGIAWMVIGSASLAGAGTLFDLGSPLQRALSYPMFGFGAIQALIGLWLLGASDSRAASLRREFDAAPQPVRDRELARMGRTVRALKVLRIGEAVLCLGGVATSIAGAATKQDFATGFGIGVAVETAVIFVLDTFHARRADRYVSALSSFHVALGSTATGPSVGLAYQGRF